MNYILNNGKYLELNHKSAWCLLPNQNENNEHKKQVLSLILRKIRKKHFRTYEKIAERVFMTEKAYKEIEHCLRIPTENEAKLLQFRLSLNPKLCHI